MQVLRHLDLLGPRLPVEESACRTRRNYGTCTPPTALPNSTSFTTTLPTDAAYLDEFITYFTEHNPGFQWGCAVRPDNVRLDDLKRMRDAGCFSVFCGTDAGSEKILQGDAQDAVDEAIV